MPKHLFLCRHAHTQDAKTNQRDFDRELSPAGIQEAILAGDFIKSFGLSIDAFFCSAAVRTQQTAREIAGLLSFDNTKLKSNQDLYYIKSPDLLQQITSFDDNWQAVIIIGHNPVVSEVVSMLSNKNIYVPTGGCNYFKSETPDWQSLAWSPFELKMNY
jgi:phosphohistidine phosphatase